MQGCCCCWERGCLRNRGLGRGVGAVKLLYDLCPISAGGTSRVWLVVWLMDQESVLNLSAFRGILNRWIQTFWECKMTLVSVVAVSVGTALLRFYFAGRVLVLSWPIDSCVSQLVCFQCVGYWGSAESLHLLSGSGNHPLASAARYVWRGPALLPWSGCISEVVEQLLLSHLLLVNLERKHRLHYTDWCNNIESCDFLVKCLESYTKWQNLL